jgi:hypothetical protein
MSIKTHNLFKNQYLKATNELSKHQSSKLKLWMLTKLSHSSEHLTSEKKDLLRIS